MNVDAFNDFHCKPSGMGLLHQILNFINWPDLTNGDIIWQLNDIVVTDANSFTELVRHLGPNDHVRLRVLRDGDPLRLAAVVVEAKAA